MRLQLDPSISSNFVFIAVMTTIDHMDERDNWDDYFSSL